MNKTRITGSIIALLGLFTVLVPKVFFEVCGAMGDNYMKCHWVAQTEVALGIATVVLGVLAVLSGQKAAASAYSVASLINGALIILIPTKIIGVCSSSKMDCNSGTKPALIITGALIIVVSAVNVVLYLTDKKSE